VIFGCYVLDWRSESDDHCAVECVLVSTKRTRYPIDDNPNPNHNKHLWTYSISNIEIWNSSSVIVLNIGLRFMIDRLIKLYVESIFQILKFYQVSKLIFTEQHYVSAVYAVVMCPSVRPSVCRSQVGVLSKRLNVGWLLLHTKSCVTDDNLKLNCAKSAFQSRRLSRGN